MAIALSRGRRQLAQGELAHNKAAADGILPLFRVTGGGMSSLCILLCCARRTGDGYETYLLDDAIQRLLAA